MANFGFGGFDLGSFDDMAAADAINNSGLFGSGGFDLGGFDDIAIADAINSSGIFGSGGFDLGGFDDISIADRANIFNAARDSEQANKDIAAAGGRPLAGYRAPGATPRGVVANGRQLGEAAARALAGRKPGSHSGTNRIGGGSDLINLLLPVLLMMAMRDKGSSGAPTATIPTLTATQKQTPYTQQRPEGYRPGQGGITYFEPVQYAPRMAAGGLADLAQAIAAKRKGGRLLDGAGDGVSDSIPATIDGTRPARLARGEYVVDARTVAELGNGSTDAGAERLDEMRRRVHAKRKSAKVGQDSKAYKHLPV